MSERKYYILVTILFAVYFMNGLIAIPKLSVTYDEGDNLGYGIRMIKGQPQKIKPFDDASTMPMLAFNALPRAIQQLKNPDLKKTDGGVSDIMSARYVTLVLSSLIGLFILCWSKELYGRSAGLFSLFLFVFCPNLNANAVLVTSDALSALFTISTAYYFWKLIRDNSWKNLILFSISISLAQLAKQSLTHLLIIFPFILLIYGIKNKGIFKVNRRSFLLFIVFCLSFLFIVNAGFLFRGTGQPLSQYNFASKNFQHLQQTLSFVDDMPLPFPEPYLSGLDLTMRIDEIGPGAPESSGPVNILGQSRIKTGFWYYYFVTLFFKTPIPVIALSVMLLVAFIREKRIKWYDEFIPVFCILYFLVYFNFFYNSQVGIRHIILVFPLLYVLLGKTADLFINRRILGVCTVLYAVITFYTFFPNLIAYSNEFIWRKKNAYRVLGNANIEYGQGYYLLQRFLQKHPEVKFPGDKPMPGQFVLSVSYYLDPTYREKYGWLQKLEPADEVEYSFLLFKISADDLKKEGY